MKFFLDTANINQITKGKELGFMDGVTTNPSLMAKEGIRGIENQHKHYIKICNIINGDVSAEVISTTYDKIVDEAICLSKLHKNIVVKIPMIEEGIKAINTLSSMNIKTNCTLVFSSGQAILAAKAGATYISPFLGRLDDISTNSFSLITDIRQIYCNYEFSTKILAASIRHPMHFIQCALIGVDVVTCPLNVILSLLKHPLTDIGLKKFLDDYKKIK